MADDEQQDSTHEVDDKGTTEAEGRTLLKRLRDEGFEGSDEKLALALGRPIEDVESLTGGEGPVDDDVVIKARGIAEERGITVE